VVVASVAVVVTFAVVVIAVAVVAIAVVVIVVGGVVLEGTAALPVVVTVGCVVVPSVSRSVSKPAQPFVQITKAMQRARTVQRTHIFIYPIPLSIANQNLSGIRCPI